MFIDCPTRTVAEWEHDREAHGSDIARLFDGYGDPDCLAAIAATKRVRMMETGELFSSVVEAAKRIGAAQSNVYEALKRGRACKGMHFERVG